MQKLKKSLSIFLSWSVFVLTFPVSAFAQNDKQIAVITRGGPGITQIDAQTLAFYMRSELKEMRTVTPVEQERIEGIMAEMGVEETECNTPDCVLEVGRRLDISHIILGSVARAEQMYDLDFRMMNVRTGAVQKTVKRTYEGDVDGLIVSLTRLVWDIVEVKPPPGRFPEERPVIIPPFVTFTANDWNVPMSIVIYGVDDYVDDGDQAYSIVTGVGVSDDPNYYTLKPPDISAVNIDDDEAGILAIPTDGLETSESGQVDSFTVVLSSEPISEVTLSLVSSDTAEGEVTPTSVIFDASNWNVPRTVILRGVDDSEDDGDQAYTIRIGPAASADASYSGLDPDDVSVMNKNDDTAGARVHPKSGLITTSAMGTALFGIALTSRPLDEVAFLLSSSDTSEGTVSPGVLTFTRDNWNVVQTVTVTGVLDDDKKDRPYRIVIDPAISTDPRYSGFRLDDISVRNIDYRPWVVVYPTQGLRVSEAGGDTSFTLLLASQPTVDVTFSLASSDTTEGVVSPSSVTFTQGNWNTPQAVTIAGVDDKVDDEDQEYTIYVGKAVSFDPSYGSMDPEDVSITSIDDDEAGMVISPVGGLITTEGGGTAEFTVRLGSEPFTDVTVSLVSSDTTEGKVSESSLTFNSANWDSAHTITVTGMDDNVDDSDVAYMITVGGSITTDDARYRVVGFSGVRVTNTDDDTKGISVTPTSGLTTSETGGVDTFTVVLTSEPTFDVLVPFSVPDSTEGAISPLSVMLTPADWNIPKPVKVTGVDDNVDDGDQTFAVLSEATRSLDPNYDGLDPSDVSASNMDDDENGIDVELAEELITSEAGGTGTFALVLKSEPSSDVSIGVRSSDGREGVVSHTSIVFTRDNWSRPQTVTVTGVDDETDDGDKAYTIVLYAAVSEDPGYNGIDPADIPVTNLDNDGPGILIHPTVGITTIETGNSATFEVVLSSQPSSHVSIGLASSDESEGVVSPTSVTFTPEDWNVPQVVSITGVDDTLADGDQEFWTVIGNVVSGDPEYNGIDPPDVVVTNKDDDRPAIIVSPTSGLTTSEAGGETQFTIMLTSAPAAEVTMSLSSSDVSEATVSPSSVTFRGGSGIRKSSWKVPKVIKVTGINENIDDGDQMVTVIVHAAVSDDSVYSGLDPDDVWVRNSDDDEAEIRMVPVGELFTSEDGSGTSISMTLGSEPAADVQLLVTSTDVTEGRVEPSSLLFTSKNWSVGQTVNVYGIDDQMDDGDQAYTVTVDSVVSNDPVYKTIGVQGVSIVNRDDDKAGMTLAGAKELVTTEEGGSDTLRVVLNSQPLADVTLSLASSDSMEGRVSPSSVVFSDENWSTPQIITVTGVDDDVDDGDQTFSLIIGPSSSDDSSYDAHDPPDVPATNKDDDIRAIIISPTSNLTTTESSATATFTSVLGSRPLADVTFSLETSDTSEGIVSPVSIAFTPDSWNVPQTATITGVDDSLYFDDEPYTIITAPAVSEDPNYNGLDPDDVSVTNKGDDGPGIIVYPTIGLTTTEAGSAATFTVVLTSAPMGGVALSLSSSDTTEGTVSPSLLTFTSDNWSAPRAVTVTGANDDIDDRDRLYTVVIGPAVSSDHFYRGLDPDDVWVLNTDDDESGIIVNPTSGFITAEAGTTATFTIVLTSEPVADVVLSLKSSDESEGIVSPSSVTFTRDDWISPKLVIITGVNDGMDDGDQTYSIRIGAAVTTDPTYKGMNPDDPLVTNNDDDEAEISVDPVAGLITSESGGQDTVTVVLRSQPLASVALMAKSTDETEGVVWPASLTFSTSNWNLPQILSLTGANDDIDDGDQYYGIVIDTAVSADPMYNGLDPEDISAANVDDDQAGIRVEPTSGVLTSEAGKVDTFVVVLASQPTHDVVVSLSTSDDTEGSLRPPPRREASEAPVLAGDQPKETRGGLLGWLKANYGLILVVAVVGGGAAALALPGEKGPFGIGKPPVFPEVP